MEETVSADQIQVGDIIKCICEQGCVKPGQCQQHCNKNTCSPIQGTWERVLRIEHQPSVQYDWIYFQLTHNKELGVWSKQAIVRYV